MQKTFLTLLLLILILSNGEAQSEAVASGGNATGSGGSVSFSVGQVNYIAITGTGGTVNEGVQQAYEIYTTTGLEENRINLELKVYPNPTTDEIKLTIQGIELPELTYTLYGLDGKNLISDIIFSETTSINMNIYPRGSYILSIFQQNHIIKSYTIIKN